MVWRCVCTQPLAGRVHGQGPRPLPSCGFRLHGCESRWARPEAELCTRGSPRTAPVLRLAHAWPTLRGPGALAGSQLWALPDLDPELLQPTPTSESCSSVHALTDRGVWKRTGPAGPWVSSPPAEVQTQEAPGSLICPRSECACQADVNAPWGQPSSSLPGEIPRFSGKGPRTQRKPPPPTLLRSLSCPLPSGGGGQANDTPKWTPPSLGTLQDTDRMTAPRGLLGGRQLLSPRCRGRRVTSGPSAHGAVLSPL